VLEALARALVERETLDTPELLEIFGHLPVWETGYAPTAAQPPTAPAPPAPAPAPAPSPAVAQVAQSSAAPPAPRRWARFLRTAQHR
jgi:hypothetical protein